MRSARESAMRLFGCDCIWLDTYRYINRAREYSLRFIEMIMMMKRRKKKQKLYELYFCFVWPVLCIG